MVSSNNFHLHFQFGSKNHDIDFINKNIENQNKEIHGGMSYSLAGEKESVEIVNKYLSILSTTLGQNISEIRKELRVKLWQAGAKEISFSEEIDQVRQEILGIRKPFDIQDSVLIVCACLEENYIFPDVAEKCSKYLYFFSVGCYCFSCKDPIANKLNRSDLPYTKVIITYCIHRISI